MKNNNQDYSANPQEWLKRGLKDLKVAIVLYRDAGGSYYEYTCFLCQQAVEKCLKAYLVQATGRSLRQKEITHYLIYLSERCKQLGVNFNHLEKDLSFLETLYTPTRYPHVFKIIPTKEDASEALKSAKKIIKFIKPFLKIRP